MTKPKPPNAELDRRIRKTRNQLRDALISLILERGWDKVSVQDVCGRADVGRSTFYVHFADKEELLLSGLDDLHQVLDAQRIQKKGSFAFVDGLVDHAKEKARLLRAIIGKRSSPNVQRQFREVVMQLVQAELTEFEFEEKHGRAVATYIGGGFAELLTTWLDRPSSLDVNTLAATFRELAENSLASFATKPSRTSRQGRK